MLKSLHVGVGLSIACDFLAMSSHAKGATKRSIIAYDEINDRICKELVSEYYMIYWDDSHSLKSIS